MAGRVRARVLCGLLAASIGMAGGAARGAAVRAVSLNLCTDELLLLLADPGEIAGLSPLARDCANAPLCADALRVPTIMPDAEAVLAARPDVLLAGTYTTRLATRAAREVGARVVLIPPAAALSDIPFQIRQIAVAVGHPERGEALAAAFEARLARLTRAARPDDPVAALYEPNGYIAGSEGLAADLLAHAGLRNLAAIAPGLPPGGRVPTEVLLSDRPDLLIRSLDPSGRSLAQAMVTSPVLARAFPPPHVVDLPDRLLVCGLPQTLDALEILRRARDALMRDVPTRGSR